MRRPEPCVGPFALLRWSFGASRPEFATLAVTLLSVWACELAIPFLLGETVDAAISGNRKLSAIMQLGGITAALMIALYVVHTAYLRNESRIVARATLALRKHIYHKLLDQPLGFFTATNAGEISHRVMIDSDVIDRHGIYLFADLPFAALTVFGIFVVMLVSQASLAILVLVTLAAAAAVSHSVSHPLGGMETVSKARWAALGGTLQDVLGGIRIVKVFGQERRAEQRLDTDADALAKAETRAGGVMARLEPLLELVRAWGFLAIVWYGAYLVFLHALTPGKLVAFIAYMERMSEPLQDAGLFVRHYRQAKASLTRIVEFLSALVPPLPRGSQWVDGPIVVEMADVSVRYSGRFTNALDGVSFAAGPGEIVALVGGNGAGKTTLTDVLLGLRQPCSGFVRIGGLPIEDWDAAALRRTVAAVPQEPFLFHSTIEDNIGYGTPDADAAEIRDAAQAAGLGAAIARLPLGLATIVGDRGCTLSGGERQRVAFARTLLHGPRLLVLDEPSSALDGDAFEALEHHLLQNRHERVSIIATHDPRLVAFADRVVELEDGRVVYSGGVADWELRRGVAAGRPDVSFRIATQPRHDAIPIGA